MRGNNKNEMNPSPDLLAPLIMAAQAMKKNMPKTVASMTGGEYEMFATGKNFDLRMIDFSNHLRSRYLLSIQPKSPHAGLHELRVRLRDAGSRTGLARSSYWARGAQGRPLCRNESSVKLMRCGVHFTFGLAVH